MNSFWRTGAPPPKLYCTCVVTGAVVRMSFSPMQVSGKVLQSVSHVYRSHVIQPRIGVAAVDARARAKMMRTIVSGEVVCARAGEQKTWR